MKTMIFSDFLSVRRSLPQSLLIALVVAFVCTLFDGAAFVGAIICAMMPVTIIFSMQLYDDQNDWSGYRLTLPVNRQQVVWGRYLFMALCAIGAFVIGCAIVFIRAILVQSGLFSQMPTAFSGASAGEFVPLPEAVSLGFFGTYIALLFVLLMLAITMPLLMRYGLTQAIRLVPVACCIVLLLVMIGLGDSGSGLLSWLDTTVANGGALWLGIGVTVLCCGIYIASAAVTAKLYAAREF